MKLKKRGIYEKVINILLDILIFMFGIILLISIYNNIQIKILGNDYSSFFGYSMFEVQTGSMADTINPGDWIVVKASKNIKLDDVITYSKDGEFITHRVVESYKGTYITKGDANNGKDEPISKKQIVGKVIKIFPGFGIIRKTFFNPAVLITLIITLYSVGYVLRTAVKKDNSKLDKKFDYKEKVDALISFCVKKVGTLINNKKADLDKNNKIEENEVFDIDVNLDDINEDEVIVDDELEIKIPDIKVEDMDKTMYFRMVSVDKMELDNTYQEIVDNEGNLKESLNEEKVEKEYLNVIEEKVDLIQHKRKRFKTIIDKAIYIKREEIHEIILILTGNEDVKLNEPTIRDTLLNAYIDAKYYNYCGNINVEYSKKNMLSRVDSEMKKVGDNLISNYKGSDNKYADKVLKYVNIYLLVNSLEQSNHLISEIQVKREVYKNKILNTFKDEKLSALELKNIVNGIIKTQKIYQGVINYIIEKLETNTFNLTFDKIVGKKNFFAVSLEHNILFSKVYSDYIVDKTYTEGIIAEDKVIVLLNLLFITIVKDMFSLDGIRKYFVYVPGSIYEKPNKLDKIFKLFDDEYAKNSVVVAIEYKDLVKYKKQVESMKKKGYRFAVVFSGNIDISDDGYGAISIVDYVFIDKNNTDQNILASMPNDVEQLFVSDDIVSKLGNFGGE